MALIPRKGLSREEIFKALEAQRADDIDWRSGRVFGYVYDPGQEAMALGKEVFAMFLTENALDFSVFPSVMNLETELAAMLAEHLNGDEEVVGNFSSGGTESIILAVKAARDYSRVKRPEIKEPEIILPITAHAAFHKAAHYLNMKVVTVPVDPETFRADVDQVRKAITSNTILLVGSAPSYAHGVVDPIRELGELALKHDLLLHTDACVGGFMLPYFKRLGEPIPDFDFSVPGVTSISVDLHKYGYTPKGASLVLYRSKDLRKHQIFACSEWTGYTIINNAVQSTRSGGPLAAAWAVLKFIGDEGYLEIARKKLEATKKLVEGIEAHSDLRLMAQPHMCMFSFTSEAFNVFHLIDEMNSIGWYIQPQLAYESSQQNIHISINYSNVEWVDAFLEDLYKCIEKVKPIPFGELGDAVKAELGGIDPDALTEETFNQLLGLAGIGESSGLPEKMTEINEILNALPARFREFLLIEFINNLFRYEKTE